MGNIKIVNDGDVTKAAADKAALISDLATLQGQPLNDPSFIAGVTANLFENNTFDSSTLSDIAKEELLEAYIYSTILYVIWNVADTYESTDGKKLGGSIKNVEGLDKIDKKENIVVMLQLKLFHIN